MSELFKAVQETLRGHKARGVDLTNPTGVEVLGKLYPATEKGIMVHEHFDGFRHDHNSAFYSIPMENGFRVQGHSSGLSNNYERLVHRVMQPHIIAHESHPATRYGWTYAEDPETNLYGGRMSHLLIFDDDGGSSPEKHKDLHEAVKKWANEPTKGTKHNWGGAEWRDIGPMSSEEHREHQQNARSGLLPRPNQLVVLQRKINARNNEPGMLYHEYDLRTEELKPHDPNKLRFGS